MRRGPGAGIEKETQGMAKPTLESRCFRQARRPCRQHVDLPRRRRHLLPQSLSTILLYFPALVNPWRAERGKKCAPGRDALPRGGRPWYAEGRKQKPERGHLRERSADDEGKEMARAAAPSGGGCAGGTGALAGPLPGRDAPALRTAEAKTYAAQVEARGAERVSVRYAYPQQVVIGIRGELTEEVRGGRSWI